MNYSEIKELVKTEVVSHFSEGALKIADETTEYYNGLAITVCNKEANVFRPEWDIDIHEHPLGSDKCDSIEYKYYAQSPFDGHFQHSKYIVSRIDRMSKDEFVAALCNLINNINDSRVAMKR